jgi:predicted RNA-binding protein with PUA-like domain
LRFLAFPLRRFQKVLKEMKKSNCSGRYVEGLADITINDHKAKDAKKRYYDRQAAALIMI